MLSLLVGASLITTSTQENCPYLAYDSENLARHIRDHEKKDAFGTTEAPPKAIMLCPHVCVHNGVLRSPWCCGCNLLIRGRLASALSSLNHVSLRTQLACEQIVRSFASPHQCQQS